MGICCHTAYNIEQVQSLGEFEYIFESDLEFYEQMNRSILSDKLETEENKRQHKMAFISLVVKSLKELITKVSNPKGKGTPEEIRLIKENYLGAIQCVNTLNDAKFEMCIREILEQL